ncbi:MarR family winged helix-turn-helix transcriptional regulator [Marinitenerispora sediminis]|uniref:Transcriptional regulator n=1 Tax=Marinitenerispora sediminis TaxID=1931232 RepID=A0A368TAV3_9ACTN|nr:MarR family transcriptional regulator [Marinitenerispora sediminis]RCV52003.1 transcriptional regulator [Marinitenerispora sediminis]RCV56914.1 transcriptional regulator [Marinitenerispora sediminis]RCV60068.1 transcriptional regulator [Marinitenerispora sediminis]
MSGEPSAERDALLRRLHELEERRIRMFARASSLPLLTTTLTVQQLKVLILLSLDGDMPARELAAKAGVQMATLTGIVDRLVARGLVLRRDDPRDRRVRRVDLTDEGRARVVEFRDAGQRQHLGALARLDTETLAGLVRGLEALCAVLEEDLAEERRRGE